MDPLAIIGFAIFFVGLMLSVALHEIGHLLPAKWFKIKVTQYMVGFGPTLWSRHRSETEYGVKLFPLGGYVRMIGMFPPPPETSQETLRRSSTGIWQTLASDARQRDEDAVTPADEPRLFYRQKWWKKLIVMLGGPAMNVILAIVLAGGVLMIYGNPAKPVYQTTIGVVQECVIPASEQRSECRASDEKTPAAQVGFQPGDSIVSIAGEKVTDWDQVSDTIAAADATKPLEVVVDRNGERVVFTPTLVRAERPVEGEPGEVEHQSFLGVAPAVDHYQKETVFGVVSWTGEFISRTAEALSRVPERMVDVWGAAFNGEERRLDTPLSIVGAGRIGGELASSDELQVGQRVATFVMLLASFNLAIALFNLIPLLPLDGGHAAGAVWEAIKRAFSRVTRKPEPRPVDVTKGLPIAYGMAVILISMSVLLIYADIVNPIRLLG